MKKDARISFRTFLLFSDNHPTYTYKRRWFTRFSRYILLPRAHRCRARMHTLRSTSLLHISVFSPILIPLLTLLYSHAVCPCVFVAGVFARCRDGGCCALFCLQYTHVGDTIDGFTFAFEFSPLIPSLPVVLPLRAYYSSFHWIPTPLAFSPVLHCEREAGSDYSVCGV